MKIVFLCMFLVAISCSTTHSKVTNLEDLEVSPENKMDTCDAKVCSQILHHQRGSEATLTKLLQYHQGSVSELEQQVSNKNDEITYLKAEILHAENTLKLVSDSAADGKQHELTLIKINQECQTQVQENSQTLSSLLSLVNDTDAKVGSSPLQCNNLKSEISELKTDLITANSAIKQQFEEVNQLTLSYNTWKTNCNTTLQGVSLTQLSGGLYYFYSGAPHLSWYAARDWCTSRGMDLTSLETLEEYNMIVDYVTQLLAAENSATDWNQSYWISLNDLAVEGSFRWPSTGSSSNYITWHGAPDNYAGVENCAHIVKLRGQKLALNDIICTTTLRFVCELNSPCKDILLLK